MTQDEAIEEAVARAEGQNSQSVNLEPGSLTTYILERAERPPEHRQAYVVVAPPGLEITEHDHIEDVVMFYARVTETPVIIADVPYLPRNGEIVVIPAGVKHRVPPNMTDIVRVSVAIKI